MYIFISEFEIQAYSNEILKRYVGNKLVKTIANPTGEDLKEFGYKELLEDERPEEKRGFVIEAYYEDGESIMKKYRYIEFEEFTEAKL